MLVCEAIKIHSLESYRWINFNILSYIYVMKFLLSIPSSNSLICYYSFLPLPHLQRPLRDTSELLLTSPSLVCAVPIVLDKHTWLTCEIFQQTTSDLRDLTFCFQFLSISIDCHAFPLPSEEASSPATSHVPSALTFLHTATEQSSPLKDIWLNSKTDCLLKTPITLHFTKKY